MSQIHHHWLKALEYTLRLPNPGNLHTHQLWRLAQLSLSEQSTNTSQKAESWRHLARIVSHFDGDIDQLDKNPSLEERKPTPSRNHPTLTFKNNTSDYSMAVMCRQPRSKNPLNKGIMQAFFEGKHAQQTPVLWNKPPHSPSLCGTTILSSAPTYEQKAEDLSSSKQQSWRALENTQIIPMLHDLGREHPLVIYEKNQKDTAQATIKSLSKAHIKSTAILETNTQEDHTQTIKHLMGLDTSHKRYEQIRKATWTPMVIASTRRQDFDSIILFTSYEEASKIIPLLRFFYADDVPTLFVPSNHLQNTQKLHDIAGAYVLDTNLGEESPSFRYGYNYLLANIIPCFLPTPNLA